MMGHIKDLLGSLKNFNLTPIKIMVNHQKGEVYFLHKIPKVEDSYLGVLKKGGRILVGLMRLSALEKTASQHSHNTSGGSLFIDEPITLGTPVNVDEAIQKLVYKALGYQPLEPYDIASHPSPNTQDNGLSGR